MVYDPDTYNGNVPDEIEGIPVRKEEAKGSGPTCLNHSDFNPIPGGVHLNETADNRERMTSFARAELNGVGYMLTAAHIWDACDDESREGETVDQYHDPYGELDELLSQVDVARTSLTDISESFVNEIQAANQRYTIEGVATENGVENYMSIDATIHKVGTSTGQTSGEIEDMNVSRSECPHFSYDGVRLTNRQAEGDSGGPGFRGYSDGGCTLVNINTWGMGGIIGEDCGGDTYADGAGTAAYQIEDYGYSFT